MAGAVAGTGAGAVAGAGPAGRPRARAADAQAEGGGPAIDPLPALLDAQRKAWRLVAEVKARGLVAPHQTEGQLSRRIHALARDMFGVRRHWHKRIVRAGPNTLLPYREDPPDLEIAPDCILFLDLGPVFERWEADIGLTLVLGDDPRKHRLARDTMEVWQAGKRWFDAHPEATGRDLHDETLRLARERGWDLGSPFCGHLVGRFPHERIPGSKAAGAIVPENASPLRGGLPSGAPRHWIYEVHLVDRQAGYGGFFEQLLTAPAGEGFGPGSDATVSVQRRLLE